MISDQNDRLDCRCLRGEVKQERNRRKRSTHCKATDSTVSKGQTATPSPFVPDGDFDDRGTAAFFHGRKKQREKFRRMLVSAETTPELGTALVIQGPPGVGKTALLGQLDADARMAGWQVAHVKPVALESPSAMAQAIGEDHVEHRGKELASGGDVGLDAAGVVKAGAGGRVSMSKTIAGTQTVSGALRDVLTTDAKLVLILDEAQHLAEHSSESAGISIRDTLNDIVYGRTGRRVVLLLGGLSHTWTALRDRGVSRLRRGCDRRLKRVQQGTAKEILRSWLPAVGCADEHRDAWVATLLPLADNWPKHLVACAAAAAEHFAVSDSDPTPASIETVKQAVQLEKDVFYNQRARGIPGHSLAAIGMLVGTWGLQETFRENVILEVLSIDPERPSRMLPQQCYEALIKQGVLTEDLAGKLMVPIPSMEHFLMAQAIDLAINAPVQAQAYWQKVKAITLSKRGRISAVLQKQIEAHFPPAKRLRTGLGGDDEGLGG